MGIAIVTLIKHWPCSPSWKMRCPGEQPCTALMHSGRLCLVERFGKGHTVSIFWLTGQEKRNPYFPGAWNGAAWFYTH